MIVLRTLASAAVLATGLAVLPATATAATTTTYAFNVTGAEVAATSTKGVFAGTTTGSSAGTWSAQVNHVPLGNDGAPRAITGGSTFGMVLALPRPAHIVSGRFTPGSEIQRLNPGSNCTNQVFRVVAIAPDHGSISVSAGDLSGTGSVDVVLTHHRKRILGTCVIYAATVTGHVALSMQG